MLPFSCSQKKEVEGKNSNILTSSDTKTLKDVYKNGK